MCQKLDVWNTQNVVTLNEILQQFIPRNQLMPNKKFLKRLSIIGEGWVTIQRGLR